MTAKRYVVAYDHGPVHGELAVWSTGSQADVLASARKELRRRQLPHVASDGQLRIASTRALNPDTPAVDRDERDVLALLELGGSRMRYYESDGDAYKAALRLVDRGLVKRVASGEQTTRPKQQWIEVALTKQGILAAANRAPDEIVVLVTAKPHRGVREMVVRVDAFEGVLAVHPSLRNTQEIELASKGKPESWGITHVPSGQLVATVRLLPWARRLAKEIMAFSDEGITSTDPQVAALAIGGPGMVRARYIADVSRQARSRRGTFPTFATWRKSMPQPKEPPPATNPPRYSFIRHDETPELVLGQMGWPQIWKYRGTEIEITPSLLKNRFFATVWKTAATGVRDRQALWTLFAPDAHSALRAAKMQVDVAQSDPLIQQSMTSVWQEAEALKHAGVARTRETLARAITKAGGPHASVKVWLESMPVALRLEIIDFVLEDRRLRGDDPWPKDDLRRGNPRRYSFVKHDEVPVLVLGQMGWPQIWSYRGTEITIRPQDRGRAGAVVTRPFRGDSVQRLWALSARDAHAALRASKMMVDLLLAAEKDRDIGGIFDMLMDRGEFLKSEGKRRTRETLARAATESVDRKWFESTPLELRLDLIDFVLEQRVLLGLDPWPKDDARRANPRRYSFIKHDEAPTLVLGQMGWPQIWSYRGTEIEVQQTGDGRAVASAWRTFGGSGRELLWNLHTPDAHSALRAAKLLLDVEVARQNDPDLAEILNMLEHLTWRLHGDGIEVTRQSLARAVTEYGGAYGTKAFERKSVAQRLEIIDYVLERRALFGLAPWPRTNPRRRNPDDIAGQAAVAAAMGALIGGVIGAAAGIVIFGAAGMALGAMASSTTGATTGLAIGAVFGLPLGAYIGTIWGAVRQTGRAVKGPRHRRAKVLAGVGAAVTGPLAPVGAAVGAYLGAPSA